MITSITIKNFKSLADFTMPLGQFNCLIGLNGAGKTTVLQALDFIGHLACGITDFRGWTRNDLITSGSNQRTMLFQIEILPSAEDFALIRQNGYPFLHEDRLLWFGRYNIDRQRFTEEIIISACYYNSVAYLSLKDNNLSYLSATPKSASEEDLSALSRTDFLRKDLSFSDIALKGSVLSLIKNAHPFIMIVQKELQSLKSLELLTPNTLRRASQPTCALGLSGEGLSGFLSTMNNDDARKLAETLQEFYPTVQRYEIKRKKFGWKDILIREGYFKNPIPAEHINDGYLRILAMLSQKYSEASFLLFDEIENGINQELIEKLLDQLQNFNGKQVLVTTHSALVLNYLTDKAARDSVIFLYKDTNGCTKAVQFFKLPEMEEKLKLLGPGEVMADTNLEALSAELAERDKREDQSCTSC